jgi:hypothetical protein
MKKLISGITALGFMFWMVTASRSVHTQNAIVGVNAWLDSREDFAAYRCNQLTQTGRLALAPFQG